MTSFPAVTQQQIDDLVALLPILTRSNFSAGAWRTPQGAMPYFEYSTESHVIIAAASALSAPFDWSAWRIEAQRLVESPELLANADFLTLRMLLTTHIRADRFTEGHLAAMFANGHLRAVLERLAVFRSSVG